jgi:DNA-binding HxlR family transcriptional regulator
MNLPQPNGAGTGQCNCPIETAVHVFEGRWTLLLMRELFLGTQRFGQLRKTLKGISPKTLTERLRHLEDYGIIDRTIYPEVPPRVEYNLTPLGRRAWPVIDALRAWGEQLEQGPAFPTAMKVA